MAARGVRAALLLAALLALCMTPEASARREGGGTCKKGGFQRASTVDGRVREAAAVVADEAADRLYDGKCSPSGRPSVLRACTKVGGRLGRRTGMPWQACAALAARRPPCTARPIT